jgi:hypothetical protein
LCTFFCIPSGPTAAATSSIDADQALAPTNVPASLYLVHSIRSELVKVGLTTATYEECRAKYSKVYGHLDTFHFVAIENGECLVLLHLCDFLPVYQSYNVAASI